MMKKTRKDRYNKKIDKFYVEIEEEDENVSEDEEIERTEETEALIFTRTLIPCLTNKLPAKPHRSSLPLLSCRCAMVVSAWTGLGGARGQEFQSYPRLQTRKQMLRARKRMRRFPTVLRRTVSACMKYFKANFSIDRLYGIHHSPTNKYVDFMIRHFKHSRKQVSLAPSATLSQHSGVGALQEVRGQSPGKVHQALRDHHRLGAGLGGVRQDPGHWWSQKGNQAHYLAGQCPSLGVQCSATQFLNKRHFSIPVIVDEILLPFPTSSTN